ncbi:DUF317 domain-containing protein [Streptomyces lancefieldiae]|uniref:DUF317 domain-containing protein n=1 Tax=Streptomyces lancefieldiae TaxID=3075520 RepID=A0ABU3AZF3_9ACTN|nr:DUF317 domain-containing protein [Streptomyces sp. DSM 40712]MDT0615563.1 DUF317 domain-containing protein [Streptomyces sp. DSM 40712]
MPRVLLSSPDQKALLRLEPDPDGRWWTLQHAPAPDRPAWFASFDARTPVEMIAAFTDALTVPTAGAPHHRPLQPPNSQPGPHHPLAPGSTRHAGRRRLGRTHPLPRRTPIRPAGDEYASSATAAGRTPPPALIPPSPPGST